VQDGCNYNCSFCTIPLARGKSRSDSIENIIIKASEIASNDIKEVVLTGVNTGDFGIQNGKRVEKFIDLIKALDSVEGIERFRISSIEPNLLTEEIIGFVAGSQKFVPHFHIPLQSGSDKILKSMYRRYKTDLYRERIKLIRSLLPEACIGVDVIVGFPGETNDDFLLTYQFLNELDISYLHVFTYSERSNTAAIDFEDPVPIKTRNERSKMLRILSVKKRRQFYERNLETESTVLFENDVKDGLMFGFTENYIRVSTKFNPRLINETRKVRLTNIGKNDCVEAEEIPELLII
jgi:threonylcarbamoyladenosine tRNA methylthiotransferase MtaB